MSMLGEDLVWYQTMWRICGKWEPIPYNKIRHEMKVRGRECRNKQFILHAVKGPPRYYYHVSEHDLRPDHVPDNGPFLLFPRAHGNNRACDEIRVPRICVADNIWACLSAVGADIFFSPLAGDIDCRDHIYVYRTVAPHIAYHPKTVLDCQLTRERWLVSPDMDETYGFDFVEITAIHFDVNIFHEFRKPLNGISLGNPPEFKKQVKQTRQLWDLLERHHVPRVMEGEKKTHVWFGGRMIPVGQVEEAIHKQEEGKVHEDMAC